MGFGVLFVLLLAVGGWWLYSRWAALRDTQARRREAERLLVFEAQSKPTTAAKTAAPARTPAQLRPTLPGEH